MGFSDEEIQRFKKKNGTTKLSAIWVRVRIGGWWYGRVDPHPPQPSKILVPHYQELAGVPPGLSEL